eukprot:CAMPEP_0206190926 /NCGR_PEP_ID=MMETSP0166-20121206/5035_1 /ASSEMBLY_ACC=CAM_ASM_000260 /TAXON_ID=95228 /ORGANISM="Vannella robusta, Strain DIVA3 518/3/11/1/6" /LENGTH=94 /DNA_ID=CAMNT_0053607087 /DNA_START=44 /DNA_END=328 /DNA_ORIENTATION=-
MAKGSMSQASQGSSSNSAGIRNSSPTSGVRRRQGKAGASGGSVGSTRASSAGGTLQFGFNDDSGGLEVSPNVVLIMTLLYIGIVILLHIWGKFQ